GYYDRAELFAMHRKMARLLASASAQVEAVLFCPHLPDAGCDCRKPAPGLVRRAMVCFGFSAEQAVMIGDSERDVAAATAMNVRAVRVGSGESASFSSLAAWVDQLLGGQG
ncbi:MAG: HAD-IIIA family hydrolase, partial [Gammaproteobacteria bacterium]